MRRRPPLLKASLSYLTGIITASIMMPSFNLLVVTATSSIIALTAIYYFHYCNQYASKELFNKRVFLATSVISFFLLAQLNLSLSGYHYKITKITSIPSGKIKYAELTIEEIWRKEESQITVVAFYLKYNEKIRLQINNFKDEISIGDTIKGKIYIYPVKRDSLNMRYLRYLALNDIYSFGYLYRGSFTLHKLCGNHIKKFYKKLKTIFITKIKVLIKDEERSSVIIALTTGFKGELKRETSRSFSKSGSMHLMAVSGLHIGFIYLFLSSIMFVLGNTKWIKLTRCLIVLGFIWSYALFTDLHSSIVRASIMISCLEISKISGRNSNSLNNLAFAFLVICILNPLSFFGAGFKLSFIATLSIIIINPLIQRCFNSNIKIINHLWKNVSLSLSCQIGTLPLTIIYFGYIPVYFMISNLLTIPLTAIVIISTALAIVTEGSLFEAAGLMLLNNSSGALIWIVKSIESLPYATIEIK